MEQPVLVQLVDGTECIINELQICTIQWQSGGTSIRMSDGRELMVKSPPWDDWLNDVLKRPT